MNRSRDKAGAIDRAIEAIYDTLLEPGRWDGALPSLSSVFDAPMVAIWRYDPASGHAYDFQSLCFDPAAARRYVEHYSAIDPATPVVLSSPVGQWNGDERLLDPKSRDQWEYVHDFALPAGVGRVGGVRVHADDSCSVYFGAQRPPGAGAFGDAAARRSNALVPHLARAARLHLHLEEIVNRRAWALVALDELSAAVCIVDKKGRVLLANQAARHDLAFHAPIRIRNGMLFASSPLVHDRLRHALDVAFASPRCASGFLTAPSAHDESVRQAMLVPVPETHELATDRRGPVAMFSMCPRRASPDNCASREIWSSLYGLTVAEGALLEALIDGVPLSEHASTQGIAMSTARTHVASLLAKTGVNSQARLVALAGTVRLLR